MSSRRRSLARLTYGTIQSTLGIFSCGESGGVAEVQVGVHAVHVVTVIEVEVDIKQPGKSTKVQNWEVQCHTCEWVSPTHFRAKIAATTTARDHQVDMSDCGVLWAQLV
jgi:hypothetical protein